VKGILEQVPGTGLKSSLTAKKFLVTLGEAAHPQIKPLLLAIWEVSPCVD